MRRWWALWVGLGLLVAGCAGADDARGDASGFHPDGFFFQPTDTARSDSGPGPDIKGVDERAPDGPDAPGADGGHDDAGTTPPDVTPPPDAGPPPDVPEGVDIPQTCGADGVGCECVSDMGCAGFDDGDLCNGQLSCQGGRCAPDPATVVDCPAADGICKEWRCQPSTGQCIEVTLIEDGRACEDGNACTGGDTCQGGACVPGPQDLCGGGGCSKVGDMACGGAWGVTTAAPTATDRIELYGCAAGTFAGSEMSYQLSAPANTQVVFEVTGGPSDRLFLVPWGADCVVSQCVGSAAGGTKLYWKENAGAPYWVIVDTVSFPSTVGVRVSCYAHTATEASEACINQVDDDWDGQTDCVDPDCVEDPFCIPRVCGDDICHPIAEDAEECPEDCAECGDGLCSEGYEVCDECVADCGQCPICGQRGCEEGESCSSCPQDCGECPPLPCADEDIVCGQSIYRSSLSGQDDTIEGFNCGCSPGGNTDRTYRFIPSTSGSVTVELDVDDGFNCFDDYDLYVVEAGCAASGCIECSGGSDCTDSATFTAQAGVPYLIVVESYSGTADSYDLRLDCN